MHADGIREPHREGQVRALQAKQREAARTLHKLAAAAGESWREIKLPADAIFTDARAAATTIGNVSPGRCGPEHTCEQQNR